MEQTNNTHAADVGARRREERSRRKCRLRSTKTLVPKTKVRFHTIDSTLEYVPSPEDQEVKMGTRKLSYMYI